VRPCNEEAVASLEIVRKLQLPLFWDKNEIRIKE
jgi:hypothetical protein